MERVTSVASALMPSLDRDFGSPIDVLYDPEQPQRASRPISKGFLLRSWVLAMTGVLAVIVFLVALRINLPY